MGTVSGESFFLIFNFVNYYFHCGFVVYCCCCFVLCVIVVVISGFLIHCTVSSMCYCYIAIAIVIANCQCHCTLKRLQLQLQLQQISSCKLNWQTAILHLVACSSSCSCKLQVASSEFKIKQPKNPNCKFKLRIQSAKCEHRELRTRNANCEFKVQSANCELKWHVACGTRHSDSGMRMWHTRHSGMALCLYSVVIIYYIL